MKKYIFIIILLFAISCALSALSCAPYAAIAQVQLETGLPNIPGNQLTVGQELPEYIKYLFIFGLGLIAFLALGYMMLGGIQYILAAGNVAKVEDAKDTIQQALIGLGLLLVSYLLLNTINPDLVNLRNPNLTPTAFQDTTSTGTIDFWWDEPPSCGDNLYQTNENSCSSQPKPHPSYICCTNSIQTVMPLSNYYIWEHKQCREGENEVEDKICKDKGYIKPTPFYVCCYVPPK
ncbi:MAG: hypothetical protein Q8N43_01910 [Candidatus Azambacteria bacterium]|nr:hypothetical protein [Candidatus Azambacteria bacterium]